MKQRILITGSSGVIGRALSVALEQSGFEVDGLDVAAKDGRHGDVRRFDLVRRAISEYDGIVHLAAISRVVEGERNPDLCLSTNVGGTRNILAAATDCPRAPWVLFASSREVYGNPAQLPVAEDCPIAPINTYGRSKADAEVLVEDAGRAGVRTAIIRLPNVYGAVDDYPERAIPAFVGAALAGRPISVNGGGKTFDFVHIRDVVRGMAMVAERFRAGRSSLPPIQFVSGDPVSLSALAQRILELTGSRSPVVYSASRAFEVEGFVGNGGRAETVLRWLPRIPLDEGLTTLIQEMRERAQADSIQKVAS